MDPNRAGKKRFLTRLAFRQTRDVVLISFVVGLMMSLFQIYLDFTAERDSFGDTIEQVVNTIQKAAAQAAFNLDTDLADEVVNGLFEYQAISTATISDDLGNILTRKTREVPDTGFSWLSELIFGADRTYAMTLRNPELSDIVVGEITVHASTNTMAMEFLQRSFLVILLGIMRNVILATILSVLFYYLLARPLVRMAEAFSNVDPDRPERSDLTLPVATRHDEMHDLAVSGNNLLSAIGQRIAERDAAEAELREFTSTLEQRVEDRTAELEKQYHAAQAANLAKRQFLANMSHELRTPMNAVLGYANLLKETDLTRSQRAKISGILASGQSLLHVINDILDFSKMEAEQLSVEEVEIDLREIIAQVASITGASAQTKELVLIFDIAENVPRKLMGDPHRLNQMLVNLINNAIKFTRSGTIQVCVEKIADLSDGARLEFSVTDTGIGLREEELIKLFEPFVQADDSMSRQYGGSGLGLAICRQLVDLMGGEIGVESNFGAGSRFHFSLPMKISQETTRGDHGIKLSNVLLLESDQVLVANVRRILGLWSINPTVFRNLEELQEISEDSDYDLIILDSHTLGEDPLTTIRSLRHVYGTNVRIVVMSNLSQADKLGGLLVDGNLDQILYKPVHELSILSILSNELPDNSGELDLANAEDIDLSGAHILLVEDNQVNQDIARAYLENWDIKVSVANNGDEAVKKVATNDYDLVLMDVQMPIMDGLQATRKIRQDHNANVPIIALTAHALQHERRNCLDSGMDDHLAKPIDPTSLKKTLARWIHGEAGNDAVSASDQAVNDNPQPAKFYNTHGMTDFREMVGEESFQSLVRGAIDSTREFVSDIEAAIQKGDLEQARKLAHGLKGMAGSLFATGLSGLAFEVEQAGDGLTLDGEVIARLKQEADAACRWWEMHLEPVAEKDELA